MARVKKVEIYNRKDGDIGVRMVAGNGEKMTMGEGYKNKSYAKNLALEFSDKLGAKFKDSTKKAK